MPTRNRPTKAKAWPITYKVFVSSSYLDNRDRRKVVADAITMAGMLWHGMELFTASTRPTVEECLRYAREADLLVGIIAWRYGWEPEGETSITEMEYDAAQERLMFLIDPSWGQSSPSLVRLACTPRTKSRTTRPSFRTRVSCGRRR